MVFNSGTLSKTKQKWRKQKHKNEIIEKWYKWKSHKSIPRQKDQRIQNHPIPVVAALIFRIVTDLVEPLHCLMSLENDQ